MVPRARPPVARAGLGRPVGVAVAALVALVALAGCRLDVTATAEIAADGPGSVTLAMALDATLVRALDEVAVDPTAPLAAAVLDSGWRLDRRAHPDGSMSVTLAHEVDGPDELAAVLRSLSDDLDEHAPALIIDLTIDDSDTGMHVRGTAQLRPADDVGMLIDGVPQGPSTTVLAELAAEMIDARLRLILPGEVVEHDGDRRDGAAVEWQLPVGVERDITMTTSRAGASWRSPALAGGLAAGLTVLVLGSATILVWRRRNTRRDGAGDGPEVTVGGSGSAGAGSGSAGGGSGATGGGSGAAGGE